MPDPHLRAADSDRAAVAEQLGRHLSDGRLTLDEYDERLARAYAARTYGDLDELLVDLPRPAAAAPPRPEPFSRPFPASAPAGGQWGGRGGRRAGARGAWAPWTTVALIVTTLWLLSSLGSGVHHFWPLWVIGPWGAVLLSRTFSGRGSGAARRGPRGW